MNTTVKTLESRVVELEASIASIQEMIDNLPKPRDRGPKSQHSMNDDHAEAVCYGEDKDLSHKDAAKKHGLSYAQVYSARGHYTFKHIHKKHAAK